MNRRNTPFSLKEYVDLGERKGFEFLGPLEFEF